MQEYEFTDKELEYINNIEFFDKSNDIHISSIQTISARLPKGKYCILVDDKDDRLMLCEDLKVLYDIDAIPQIEDDDFKFLLKFCHPSSAPGITFNVPSKMDIQLNLVHERPEHFAHIIYTLRKQAIYNHKLEQEKDLLNF
ncbi:MAG: hypothetical protein J6Q15_02495 [Clostridia bacterium]|nr:hypothetical protein [Clostridia bacterium]